MILDQHSRVSTSISCTSKIYIKPLVLSTTRYPYYNKLGAISDQMILQKSSTYHYIICYSFLDHVFRTCIYFTTPQQSSHVLESVTPSPAHALPSETRLLDFASSSGANGPRIRNRRSIDHPGISTGCTARYGSYRALMMSLLAWWYCVVSGSSSR